MPRKERLRQETADREHREDAETTEVN